MAKKGHFHGRPMMRAEFDIPLPPYLGGELVRQNPPSIEGWVAVEVRVGLTDRRISLLAIQEQVIGLLVDSHVAERPYLASIACRWDRTVQAGRACVSVRSSIPPQIRIGAETRAKIAKANARREIRYPEASP